MLTENTNIAKTVVWFTKPFFTHCVLLCFVAFTTITKTYAKDITVKDFWDSLIHIEENNSIAGTQRLTTLYALKTKYDALGLPVDSVYARLLYSIGKYEYSVNKNCNRTLLYLTNSVKINTSGNKGSSKYFAIRGYYGLGWYYQQFSMPSKAASYFDKAISLAKTVDEKSEYILQSRESKVNIFFNAGDYEKCADESLEGMNDCLQQKDSSNYLYFFNQRVQALCFENQLVQSRVEIEKVIQMSSAMKDEDEFITALTTKAFIWKKLGDFTTAVSLFKQVIEISSRINDYENLAGSYSNLGNLYLDSLHDFTNAKKCYFKAMQLAVQRKDTAKLSRISVNLGQACFTKLAYKEAAQYYLQALAYLNIDCKTILTTPTVNHLDSIEAKKLVLVIMGNTTELLLNMFKTTGSKKYIDACVTTALVTDSIIDKNRHEQSSELSQLFWRDFTKQFYMHALEACFLASDKLRAFYFMEKSRAALLNDRLNELAASTYLRADELATEQYYRLDVLTQQQILSAINSNSPKYLYQQRKSLKAKNALETYIQSLEEKYPSYYQYKYANNVPSLSDMQKYLVINNQSFIHYFINDTVAFILATTSNDVKFIRLSAKQFNPNTLSNFQQFCSNKQLLQNNYPAFAKLANTLYSTLFKQLQIPAGKIIICGDDFLVPFEAFCMDTLGKQFLINNYAFSYVYSASYLLKKLTMQQANGNFLGIAPVSFTSYKNVADLTQSADALKASQQYYNNSKLLLLQKASRQNFFTYAPSYAVVTVFSHASADTTDKEPVIFMHDSAIHLSELLLFTKPATQLVILSACQTNVGKKATGEGIYSLARGFSAAGIPAVAATLWLADDQAIYNITQMLNRNIEQGMCKDVALQNAKLAFMQTGGNEKLLPYYWANMVTVGNVQPVRLADGSHPWLIITAAIAVFLLGFFARAKLVR